MGKAPFIDVGGRHPTFSSYYPLLGQMLSARDGRTTQHIGAKAAQTLYYAVGEQAEHIGLPLTTLVTINFALTVMNPREATPRFQKLRRNHFNKWITRPRSGSGPAAQPTYAFVFENVRDGVPYLTMGPSDPHNIHVHWLVHIPPTRAHDFSGQIWDWVEWTSGKITGGDETIRIKEINDPKGLRRYVLKGINPSFGVLYAAGQTLSAQGIIIGQRASTSRNLGPTARRSRDRASGIWRRRPSRGWRQQGVAG